MPNPTISDTGLEPLPALILASASRYRAELLARLGVPFRSLAAAIDESAHPGEDAPELAQRLAFEKARVLQTTHPEALILGSDQVAALGNQLLGKPGTREIAAAQLQAASGKQVVFHTAVVLLSPSGRQDALDQTAVRFRTLEAAEIERYLDAEPALDCAGSFKCEGLGISLFEAIDSSDPTALIGLPLIAVCRMLRAAGYRLP